MDRDFDVTEPQPELLHFVVVGVSLAVVVVVEALGPAAKSALRAVVRPAVERRARRGVHVVLAVQRRLETGVLTAVFGVTEHVVGVTFYITALPVLFWGGAPRLARSVTLLLSATLYVGNALKDFCSSPRPSAISGRVRLPGKEGKTGEGAAHAAEFGWPSTHVSCSIALAGAVCSHTGSGLAGWAAAALWVGIIGFGRLYLGMHTPIDLRAGFLCGSALLVLWEALLFPVLDERWIASGGSVTAAVLCTNVAPALALWRLYPRPTRPTPSRQFAVYFLGVSVGIVSGVQAHFEEFHSSSVEPLAVLTAAGALRLLLRFVTGLAAVLGAKEACDALVKAVSTSIGLHKLELAQDVRRLVSYAAVGYTVTGPAFLLFERLGL